MSKKYPYLGIYEDGMVVLFYQRSVGTCVEVGNNKTYTLGEYDNDWSEDEAETFTGRIELSNNKITTYETPEQYKQRTGKDYPDDWAVYYMIDSLFPWGEWEVDYCWYAKNVKEKIPETIIITALNGKPDPDWRPE